MLGTLQQNRELSSHILDDLILSQKIERKKKLKDVKIWRFFQYLIYNNFR